MGNEKDRRLPVSFDNAHPRSPVFFHVLMEQEETEVTELVRPCLFFFVLFACSCQNRSHSPRPQLQ